MKDGITISSDSPENSSPDRAQEHSGYVFHDQILSGFIGNVSFNARKRMFDWLMELAKPDAETKTLDVGVTNDSRVDSNFFEQLYRHPDKITAVGLENCDFLEKQYAGLQFVKADGKTLPFLDKSFDLCVSFAVIEHVGSRMEQKKFISELCRVSNKVCITTPNRWFPLELHTMLPLVHWLPVATFRKVAAMLGKEFLSREENLNLLDVQEVLKLIPTGVKITVRRYRLLGFVSNLFFYLET